MITSVATPRTRTSIRELFEQSPEIFNPLLEFTERAMRAPGALTQGERELLAAMTSALNQCEFCFQSHLAVADHLNGEGTTVETMEKCLVGTASLRHLAFMAIAEAGELIERVPDSVYQVLTEAEVLEACTVVAAFSLFNRLVHFYGIEAAPEEVNRAIGKHLAEVGYLSRT